MRYCSLICYKDIQHAECTESFYKDSVTAEIQSRDLDRNDKNKMLEMLKRLEEEQQNEQDFLQDDDDDEDHYELLERFSNIDLDNTDPELIWNLLSDKERKEFESVLNEIQTTGQWGKLDIPTYEPWWQEQTPLVYDEQEQEPYKPELPSTIPDFTKMSKPESRSSPHLAWNLLHILALYSYLMRHSMGDLYEDLDNTIQQCQDLSIHVLFSTVPDCPYKDVRDVVIDLVEHILTLENKTHVQRNNNTHRRFDLQLLLLQDIDLLLKEPVRAVHDFYKALNHPPKKKKAVLLASRKLYFYLAVAGYMDKHRLDILHAAIQGELVRVETEKQEFQQGFDAAQDAIEAYQKQQNKIQEL